MREKGRRRENWRGRGKGRRGRGRGREKGRIKETRLHFSNNCMVQCVTVLTLWVLKLLIKFTPRGITADNYAPTACSAAR